MASWLLDLFTPVCARIVWVTAPVHREQIRHAVRLAQPGFDSAFAVQFEPLGMADAIEAARPLVETPKCLVVWGDQVGLRPETVVATQEALESGHAAMALPTVKRRMPYIHVIRDERGCIREIRQAREGEFLPAREMEGESDVGLFAFRTRDLFDVLALARSKGVSIGARTREFNLLPLVPLFEQRRGGVVTVSGALPEEAVGVNSREDARVVGDWLRSSRRRL
jgi:bifunctional N-acetylglucosamine-1-phosphate-uridyltransferase/glucosamine-1-phosphate-acetyltransferase GlmU-like protein